MQASLEAEARGKAEAMRVKKKLEQDINELEVALDTANRGRADAEKNIKKYQQQIRELQQQVRVMMFRAVFVRFSLGDYSGHGGCQIGKRRIVVHKYTGLARKWNRGVVRGVRVDLPQRGSAELSGGQLPLAGGQTPLTSPRQIQP